MNDYGANSISVLEGLECIRLRPDMYIGSPSGNPSDGLYRLCREILDNSIDEYLANCNSQIYILHDTHTHSTTIIDNGRGIPVGWNDAAKMDALTVVVTKIHAGGKFNHNAYKTSSGKNGVGASAVNALSTHMQVWSNNSVDNKWYTQTFAKGVAQTGVEKTKLPDEFKQYIKKTGTIITWTPDASIFKDSINLNLSRLKRELHDIQYLCPKLNIHLIIDGSESLYYSEKGLSELVSRGEENETIFEYTDNTVDVAINFTKEEGYDFKSYVNVCYTNLGGTHLQGLKKTICSYIKSLSKEKILNDDILEGMIGAIHCRVAEPQYQGQTKNELTNTEVEKQVITVLTPALEKFFKKNKSLTEKIVEYAEEMLQKKLQMKASKDLLKGIAQLNTGAKFISDKFLDADRRKHKDVSELEMFIVEGDSAGGHFAKARSSYQAELKIRGKMINAAKSTALDLFGGKLTETDKKKKDKKEKKSEGNKEIRSIVSALGCGIQEDYDEKKLRFGRIIILCFTGDTKVKLLDGTEKTFEELVEYEKTHPDTEYWVYSMNEDGELVPGKAMHPRITGYVNELIELTLDNGATIKCTPEHLFMLRDGSYKAAKDLTTEDSLMPLYTKFNDVQCHNPDRELYYNNITQQWEFTHKRISECVNGEATAGMHVHHIDGNYLNNSPTNLQILPAHEHRAYHSAKHMIEYNKSDKHKQRISELWKNSHVYDNCTWSQYNGTDHQKEMLKAKHANGDYSYNAFRAYNERQDIKEKHSKQMTNMNQDGQLNKLRLRNKLINIGMILSLNNFKLSETLFNEHTIVKKFIGICPNTSTVIEEFESFDNYVAAVNETLSTLATEALEILATKKYRDSDEKIKSNIVTKKNSMASIGKKVLDSGLALNSITYMNLRKELGSIRTPKYENLTKYFTNEQEFVEYCTNYNHKIVSKKVIHCTTDIPVYDFTVDQYHNFLLGNNCNVFAHQCDADVDGQHIANLALAFFIMYMPDLVKNGHVYVVDAPLFIGNSAKCKKFGMTRAEVDAQMAAEKIKDYDILRLKGWGECTPEQLSELCLDKRTRKLKQIVWTGTTEDMLEKTMGQNSNYRKQLLGVN